LNVPVDGVLLAQTSFADGILTERFSLSTKVLYELKRTYRTVTEENERVSNSIATRGSHASANTQAFAR